MGAKDLFTCCPHYNVDNSESRNGRNNGKRGAVAASLADETQCNTYMYLCIFYLRQIFIDKSEAATLHRPIKSVRRPLYSRLSREMIGTRAFVSKLLLRTLLGFDRCNACGRTRLLTGTKRSRVASAR